MRNFQTFQVDKNVCANVFINKLKHRLGSKSSIISAECMGVYHEVAVKNKERLFAE
jgi:hypothetical protein